MDKLNPEFIKTTKIYILSTGRSGTTLLYRFLKKYYSEMDITHQTKWSRLINILGNLPLSSSFKCWIIQKAFYHLKKQEFPKSTIDPLLSYPISELLNQRLFDHAKVIHLVRHPEDFATSFLNWKSASLKKTVLHTFIPFWQPVPFFHGVSFVNWLKMSKFEKFCWIWNYKNYKFNKLKEKYQYKLVTIESLTHNSKTLDEEWNSLLDFMNLTKKDIKFSDFVRKKVNKSKIKDPIIVDKENKLRCENLCKNLATSYGYTFK